jgi:Uma2 family endonuclease
MEALKQTAVISVEEYLAGEERSEVRHEYVGGLVYAMAGASDNHIAICMNLAFALRHHVRGSSYRVLMTESKARLSLAQQEIFYYPDVMVYCDPRDNEDYFKRYPKILVEVLSPSTEGTDRREKFLNYRQIETLQEYVLVAQDKIEMTVFRRSNRWQPEVLTQSGETLRLPSLEFQMPVTEVYEGAVV